MATAKTRATRFPSGWMTLLCVSLGLATLATVPYLARADPGDERLQVAFRSSRRAAPSPGLPASEARPNILIILADDLGYSDLGCYGGEIRTPNLDALAARGLRFTQFYNSARCCPSRASLLTGLYPHQSGLGDFAQQDRNVPGYRGRLMPNSVTLAEVLKTAGYRTFASGKWHVNLPGPTRRGFEEFYGFLMDYGVDGWEPKWMERLPRGRPERAYGPGEFFATNAITDYALDFLDLARRSPEKPWFLYVAYQAPHFPLQAPAEDIARYKNTYKVGWDVIRRRRFERMKKLGVIEPHHKLSERSDIPRPDIARRNRVPDAGGRNPPWEALDADRQADLACRMAVYAAMVDNMDQNIGRIIAELKARGELANTLIFFLSDNGACAEWDPYGFQYPQGSRRVHGATPTHPNVLHRGTSLETLGGPGTALFSYGSAWANASNTPFTLYKHYVHEGGISSPLIIHWPARVHPGGSIYKHPGHFIDIMATCVDVARARYPRTYRGEEITPPEGVSLTPAFAGRALPERTLVFQHEGHAAIRKRDWKLVSRERSLGKDRLNPNPRFELYNMAEDRSEMNDLSSRFPERVEALKALLLKELRRTRALPSRR